MDFYLTWVSPNIGATNSSGFTGLPGGYRSSVLHNGDFYEEGITAEWWTFTVSSDTKPYSLYLEYGDAAIVTETNLQTVGFSVRCLKD